jgi:hypothetical protein
MMECLVDAIEKMDANTDANQEKKDARIDANQEKMEDRLDANNDKFGVLWGTLISRMDIHQSRTLSTQEEMKAKMDIHQEKMEAAIHSICSELDIIKHRMEDVLLCRPKELTKKFDETQVDLQTVKTSLVMQMKNLQETLADMRNDLHEEISLTL